MDKKGIEKVLDTLKLYEEKYVWKKFFDINYFWRIEKWTISSIMYHPSDDGDNDGGIYYCALDNGNFTRDIEEWFDKFIIK